MKNLWKNLDQLTADINNPVDLVRTQSDYLEEGTESMFWIGDEELRKPSVLSGEILGKAGIERDFMYKLNLKSPYVPDYEYNIATIYYGITFYPLLINAPKEIGAELATAEFDLIESPSETRMYFLVKSEKEFESALEVVLNSDKVRTILKNMKAIIGKSASDE